LAAVESLGGDEGEGMENDFDDPDALLAAAAIEEVRELHTPAPKHRLKRNEAQQERIRALERQGYAVRLGPTGATIFRWGR
jgi:hypothetical protein